ncbi:MAG: hypothetical protein KatS3mg088_435 [Patescibacteria group bacterium]|nr:MAG: hypothetical protein KatS3mg088_435 [Patescibacteria group bacterium]
MKIKLNYESFLIILFLFFSSLITLKNIFHPGIYTAHDIWHNLARLNYYFQFLKDGQVPPYFGSNLAYGFGYPLFLFSYHLPWIFGSFLMWLGFGDVNTIKFLFLFSFFLSCVSMYYLAFEISKNKFISLVSSILYLWAPYRFFIIYVSAAVGISFTFIFVPLLFLGLIKIYKSEFTKGLIWMTVGLTGLILSHFPTLVVFLPLFLLLSVYFFFMSSKKGLFIKFLFLSFVLSLGISSFYFIPAFYYKGLVLGLPSVFHMGFVTLRQLIYSKWGFGIIVNSASENPFSFQIGISQWLIFLVSFLFVFLNRGKSKNFPLILILIFIFCFNVFLSTSLSKALWSSFISKTGLDFPFRFIYPNVFISSLLFVYLIREIKNDFIYYFFSFLLLFIAFYTNRNHIRPNMFLSENEFRQFVNSEVTTSTYGEYFPSFVDLSLANYNFREMIMKQNNLSLVYENSTKSVYKVSLDNDGEVVLPKYAYSFISLYINGVPHGFMMGEGGLITLSVNRGLQEIEVVFNKSFIMKLSFYITVLSLFVFLLILWKNIKRNYEI